MESEGCATVAVDVGGTEIKAAIRQADGAVVAERRWSTPRVDGPAAAVAAVHDAIDALLREAPETQAIGLVVPGTVDDAAGVALYSENIGWRDVPFRDVVSAKTGLPVGFGHDVRAGGLAERILGAARDSRDCLFMPIGTGISGAMTIGGTPVSGMYAGEIGHLDVGSPYVCACGSVGCLETVATGPSIARAYESRTGKPVAGAKPVVEAMLAGDGEASAVWQVAIDGLARALTSYITLLAPDRIVVGGGLSAAGELLVLPLGKAIQARLTWQQLPQIVVAELGDQAGNVGAHLLALQAYRTATGEGRSQ